jgi:hypothetical protein
MKCKDVNFKNGLTEDGSLESTLDKKKIVWGEADSVRIIPHSAATIISGGDWQAQNLFLLLCRTNLRICPLRIVNRNRKY